MEYHSWCSGHTRGRQVANSKGLTFNNALMEQRPASWGGQVHADRHGALWRKAVVFRRVLQGCGVSSYSALAKHGDLGGVAAKEVNVCLDPLEGKALVEDACVKRVLWECVCIRWKSRVTISNSK